MIFLKNITNWRCSQCIAGQFLRSKIYQNSKKTISISAIKCRDVDLSYDVYDEMQNDQIPVVVCHGLYGSKTNWRSLAKRLNSSTGRKIITYDAVNHGASSHHKDMSYLDMSKDMIKLLDQLQIANAILVGHSMGGKSVMTAALSYPDRIEKLAVVDAAPDHSKSMGEVMVYLEAMAHIDMSKMTNRKMVDDELKAVAPADSLRAFLMSNLLKTKEGFAWRLNLDAIKHNYHYIHSFPDLGTKYIKPTLFIGGGRSTYITDVEIPKIVNYFPEAQIKHIPDAGHWVHSEKPNEFLEILLPFIT